LSHIARFGSRRLGIVPAGAVVAALLVAACGNAVGPALGHLPAASPGAGLASSGPAVGPVASWPPVGALPVPAQPSPTPGLPGRVVSADWPAAVGSTPDPGFVLHVPVLMYHRIVDPADAGQSLPGLVVDPAVFAEELALLHGEGWHTIALASLQVDLATGVRPPARTFVITIDDGHLDGLTNALPILQRFGFVATYFVVMGRITDPGFLSASDLRVLAGAGMEIADHTMNHVDVGRLHGPALAYQVAAAAEAIKRITGRAPATFAYPSGESSLEAAGAVESAGMGLAVTTQEGVSETWPARFFVPRLRVSPSLTPDMLVRIMDGYAID
jgi:peptidoglycan/xylan/chitin deacetylase (PgdA/CDA1 family)